MLLNRIYPYYKKEYYFSFIEILADHLTGYGYSQYPYGENKYDSGFIWELFDNLDMKLPANLYNDEDGTKEFITDLIYLLFNRYAYEYCMKLDENVEGDTLSEISSNLRVYHKQDEAMFMTKLLNIIANTYDKYAILLKGYQNNKDALLNKLTRETQTEGSGSGTNNRRDNDTPQDSGTFTDNTHTSFYTEGADTSSMESNTSEIWDNEAIIDRLSRIEEKMANVMKKWSDEFSVLFIEGGNIHEI